MASNKVDIVTHLLGQCRYLMKAFAKIEEDTGFGTIQFEVKDKRVAWRTYTVRDHSEV